MLWLLLLLPSLRLTALATGAVATVRTRRFALSESPDTFDTEADNAYVNESIALVPAQTALVLVDVWNDVNGTAPDPVLAENELQRMVPLLAAARQLGMLIVHAPSESPEWSGTGEADAVAAPIAPAAVARTDVPPAGGVRKGEVLVTGTNGSAGSPSRCDAAIAASGRTITTVLMTGYDTNKCVVDKPCGLVSLSTQLPAARFIVLRDVTRGQFAWLGNAWYGQHAAVNMLELGWWRGAAAKKPIRSMLLADLLIGTGLTAAAASLKPLQYPAPSAKQHFRPPAAVGGAAGTGTSALVVMSCSSDYKNNGFAARVAETRRLHLEPLLAKFRSAAAAKVAVVHVPNGHALDGACTPAPGEYVANSTADFDAYLNASGITSLYYAGFAANTDMMFGVGGMQRYYSNSRYLKIKVPRYFWVEDCTIAQEHSQTLEGSWAKKFALAYRQPQVTAAGNVATSASVLKMLCALAPKTGPLYELRGTRQIRSPADVITDTDIDGSCGPSLVGNATSITISMSLSTTNATLHERKALSFMKSVGSPWAVFQVRLGDAGTGNLEYQTANETGWRTYTVAKFFEAANVTYKLVVVHAGTSVKIWRNSKLVAHTTMNKLDYSNAAALRIGSRKMPEEDWSGSIGDVLIRSGAYEPSIVKLPPQELAAL